MTVGAEDSRFIGNNLTDNDEYGIFALLSTGTQMIANSASGSGEAGLYVGDSPDADAKVIANDLSHNLFGLFVRDAGREGLRQPIARQLRRHAGPRRRARSRGRRATCAATSSRTTTGCAQSPQRKVAGRSAVSASRFEGAHDVDIRGNIVTGNTAPAGVGPEHGGIGVVTGEGGTVPTDNTVKGNIIEHNSPDILWDGAGSNPFSHNVCSTSTPNGLC